MDSVAKRTRRGWEVFYRNAYEERKKREKVQESGGGKECEENSKDVGGKVDVGKKKNLDVKGCVRSGEKGVEWIGSSRNVVGEKVDLKKKKKLGEREMHDDDISVVNLEQMGDGVSVDAVEMEDDDDDDDSVHLEKMDEDYSVYLEKKNSDDVSVVESEKMDEDYSVYLKKMNSDDVSVVELEKMDEDYSEKMNGDDVSVVELEKMGDDELENWSESSDDDDDSDDDYKHNESESSDSSYELVNDGGGRGRGGGGGGGGEEELANIVEDCVEESCTENDKGHKVDVQGTSLCNRISDEDKVVSIDQNEFLSIRSNKRSHKKKDSKNDEVVNNKLDGKSKKVDKAINIDENEWLSIRRSKRSHKKKDSKNDEVVNDELDGESKKVDKAISIDEEELFPIRNRARSCDEKESKNDEVVNDKLDDKSKKVDKAINIDEEGLFPIRNRARSCDEKESKNDAVVNDKLEDKSKKVDKAINIDEEGLFPIRNSARSCDEKESKDDEAVNLEKMGPVSKGNQGPEVELIKILLDSINARKDEHCSVEKNASTHILPIRFRFDDEVVEPPPEKSEWEEYVDSLFQEMELGLRQAEMDSSGSCEDNDYHSSPETIETPTSRCERGEHFSVLDEEIGIVCKHCHAIIMDIKYVLPEFYIRPCYRRQAFREADESPGSTMGPILFPGGDCRAPEFTPIRAKGTVWDLVPGIEQGMFPHQREGFEFIWRNVAGDIFINNLKEEASGSRGCIISHAPGTGKTRLTIAFLQTFLKQYPGCCPMIIAPKGMLLNWESELSKWNFDIPFHNLNKKDLSGKEKEVAGNIWKGVDVGMSREVTRVLKLYSWTKDGGILGVSYALFVKLTRELEKGGQLHEKMKEMLLECPGVLVLDEGHTPRNEQSLIWQALTNVSTPRRIILSGTPFQNNMVELFNTLRLVNPEFVKQIGCEDHFVRQRWMALAGSIGKNREQGLRKLRGMLDAFVHVHRGTILEDHLPGLRHTVVFLHPTAHQKAILEEASSKEKNVFRRVRLVSMVSVHPSLKDAIKRHDAIETSKSEQDVNAGVKMKFLLKLVWLADAMGERVLIFSQFLDPLTFIMKQMECHLSWREGRELLYMDGQLDEKQRQDSISSFNDSKSEAKVLLASQRACSEGINLVGASRVVLLDTVWNPSMEKQATSRAYRLGQTKMVHVYRLFTSGVEVRQFAQQIKKVQISELLFCGGHCKPTKNSSASSQDKLLEAMLHLQGFNAIFEKIIYQPDESHLIDIFGLDAHT